MSAIHTVSIEVQVDLQDLAGSLRRMTVKEAHSLVEDFLAGLDTDSYDFARQWIADNPVTVKPCPRCTRLTMTGKDLRCEYCKGLVP